MTGEELGYEVGQALGVLWTTKLKDCQQLGGDPRQLARELNASLVTDLDRLLPRELWDLPTLEAFELAEFSATILAPVIRYITKAN